MEPIHDSDQAGMEGVMEGGLDGDVMGADSDWEDEDEKPKDVRQQNETPKARPRASTTRGRS